MIEPDAGAYAISPRQEDGLHLRIAVEVPVCACMRGSTFAIRRATREGIARLRGKQQVRRLVALLGRWQPEPRQILPPIYMFYSLNPGKESRELWRKFCPP